MYFRYATAGRWEDKQRLRDEMDQKNIVKIPGRTQIEVNGRFHTFAMRDYSHPELDKIDHQIAEMQKEYPVYPF